MQQYRMPLYFRNHELIARSRTEATPRRGRHSKHKKWQWKKINNNNKYSQRQKEQ